MGQDGKLVRPGILLSTATDSLAPQIAFLPVHGDTSRWVIASKSVDFPVLTTAVSTAIAGTRRCPIPTFLKASNLYEV